MFTTEQALAAAAIAFGLTPEEAVLFARGTGSNPQNGGPLSGFNRPDDLLTTGKSEIEWL